MHQRSDSEYHCSLGCDSEYHSWLGLQAADGRGQDAHAASKAVFDFSKISTLAVVIISNSAHLPAAKGVLRDFRHMSWVSGFITGNAFYQCEISIIRIKRRLNPKFKKALGADP